jgi:predicted metal-binding protein
MKKETIPKKKKIQKKYVPKKVEPFRSSIARKADLERYRLMALELGASDAKIISSDQIIIEDRVVGKCKVPPCRFYGTNRNCPPYAPAAEEMRKIIKEYESAIFIRLLSPSEDVAGRKAIEEGRIVRNQKKIYDIVSQVESQAFYDGYYLAMGLGAGPCKRALCHDAECSALVPGQGCRHNLRARPASEAVGINCYKMAALVGWDIYPIGKSVSPENVPHGTRLGLVLID